MPIERAVPLTIKSACSGSSVFRSGIFVRATSSACCLVSLPTLFRLGSPEALASPAAFLRRAETGGIFVMNWNERSSKTVMTAGIVMPASMDLVRSLNCLQKSMMLTPCWPSAGPTGGAGFAAPAGICSLITVLTFFAISFSLLQLLHLQEVKLDGGGPAKNSDHGLEFGL